LRDVIIYSSDDTDQNIGYGPTFDGTTKNPLADTGYDNTAHPPPPPITARRVTNDTTEVLKFDSNFIMTKPGENMAVRQVSNEAEDDELESLQIVNCMYIPLCYYFCAC